MRVTKKRRSMIEDMVGMVPGLTQDEREQLIATAIEDLRTERPLPPETRQPRSRRTAEYVWRI